jgi:tRNA threonylcarbamoyl adenosine modification protein YeaZ
MGARPLGLDPLASTIVLALGIDTSTPMVSVALVESEVVARRDVLAHNAHGEVLAAVVAEVFRAAGRSVRELDAIGVGLGPGPFTGLRVGIVTAAAMSDAAGVPAFGMCSLDTIIDPDNAEPYAVMTDARRRQVYWAVYDAAGSRVEGPEITAPDEVAEHLRRRVRRIIGPAAEHVRWPDAARLAAHAQACRADGRPAEPLTPMYLRRPDAREPGPPKKVTPA